MGSIPPEYHRLETGSRLSIRRQDDDRIVVVVQVKDGLIWISGVAEPGGKGERVIIEHRIPGDARYLAPARVEFVPPETFALRRIGEWERNQRRSDVRISTHGVDLWVISRDAEDDARRLPMLDVSAGGAAGRTAERFEEGDEVMCRFELPGENRFELGAKVVRLGRSGKGCERRLVAFAFRDPLDDQRTALLRWIYREQTRRYREMRRSREE